MIKTYFIHKIFETCINVFFESTLTNFTSPIESGIGKTFEKIITLEYKNGVCIRTVLYSGTMIDRKIINGEVHAKFAAKLAYIQVIGSNGTEDTEYVVDYEKYVSASMVTTFDFDD